MTLNEAVMQTEGTLFIGSASSYVFIGTREEFDKYIDAFCEDYRTKLRETLTANEDAYEDAKHKLRIKGNEYAVRAKEMYRVLMSWDFVDSDKSPLFRQFVNVVDTLRAKSVSIPKQKRQLAEWTSWRDRAVDSISKIERGTQILFVGEENGDYWLEEECKADMRRRRKHG